MKFFNKILLKIINFQFYWLKLYLVKLKINSDKLNFIKKFDIYIENYYIN